jgi:hypothetical protein
MNINLAKNKLYYLLLKILKLDHIEYGYLYPFLKEAAIYGGYSDIILIANQLSHQIQDIYGSTKQLQQLLEHDYLSQNEPNAHLYAKLNLIKLKAMHKFTKRVLYYNNTLLANKPIKSFRIPRYFLKKQKYFQYRFILENFEETIFMCLFYILCNKIWKIKYWYPLILQVAFDCQELTIAKHFVEITKAELRMIGILVKYNKR